MPRLRSCCVVSEPVLSPVASFFIHTDSMFQSLSVLEIRVSGQEGKGDCNRVACITLKIKARWWEWDAQAILTMQSKNCSFTNTYMRDHFSHMDSYQIKAQLTVKLPPFSSRQLVYSSHSTLYTCSPQEVRVQIHI